MWYFFRSRTGDHAQCGTFSAAGGTDQDDEFTVFYIQVEVIYSLNVVVIYLVDMLNTEICHFRTLLILCGSLFEGGHMLFQFIALLDPDKGCSETGSCRKNKIDDHQCKLSVSHYF